jgi:hypothetical protein
MLRKTKTKQNFFDMTRWTSADLASIGKAKKAGKVAPETANAITARMNAAVLIGIDPGTHTGVAIKMHGDMKIIETVSIWVALNLVKEWAEYEGRKNTLVRIEDARLRTWFGNTGTEKWKGAGSIGRDCAIWEEVMVAENIPFEMVHPKNVKATTAAQFKALTGWAGRTSIHAREAAWLIL